MTNSERIVLTEFLELYRELPCLWDVSADEYKDKVKRLHAWELLRERLKVIDPQADIKQTKKKIEHLRTSYKREFKKVQTLRFTGAKRNYVPSLWFYKLLSFLDSKDEQSSSEVETHESDEESQHSETAGSKRKLSSIKIDRKQQRLTDTPEQQNKTSSSFGIYVGEQLEGISKFQRQVAEKLISDVLFLAKTGSLNIDSKIETSRSQLSPSPQHNEMRSPSESPNRLSHSPNIQLPHPPLNIKRSNSPPNIKISYSPPNNNISNSPPNIKTSNSPLNIKTSNSPYHSPSSPLFILPDHSTQVQPKMNLHSPTHELSIPSPTDNDDNKKDFSILKELLINKHF